MRPMGKPKPGLENRFEEIFALLSGKKKESFGLWGMLTGRKPRTQEELTEEWFAIQVPSYETLKAPQIGRDAVADIWIEQKYKETKKDISLTQFIQDHSGYYVIELSPEQDGVPVYISWGNDENVFRGQFVNNCINNRRSAERCAPMGI